jgi:two-component system response regulator FixJ
MVVNDDEALRDALRFALHLEGADVCLHADGAGALADPRLKDAACLVLRNHLPGGIEGFEVLRRVRDMGLSIPVILLASASTRALRARAAAAGVWLVLEKPVMDGALVNAVAGLLREIT